MKTKTLILTILTVALLLSTVALPVAAERSIFGSLSGLGDLDENGKVNGADYALLKRHILKTYTLSERLICSADINLDGKVSSADYAMLKRMVMKTYQPDRSWLGKPAEELTRGLRDRDKTLKRAAVSEEVVDNENAVVGREEFL